MDGAGRRLTSVLVAGALAAAGCTGAPDRPVPLRPGDARPATTAVAPPAAPAGLQDAYACRGGFTCGELPVPLDHEQPDGEQLRLQVSVETDATAPRGVLVALNGGPGAAGAPLGPVLLDRLGPDVVAAYRVVVVDQRGTGPSALRCPALQRSTGVRFTPSEGAVVACAKTLGATRALYGTDDVVADLDALRVALDVPGWSLFAVSYGTFVAQQYAARHPARTTALALDSPIPLTGSDTLRADAVAATPRVLRLACSAARDCAGDPSADLAAVVARDGDGADLLELVRAMSTVSPSYDSLLPALRSAAGGDRGELDRLLDAYRTGSGSPPEVFSAGLHASALCADQRFPWGRSDAAVRSRAAAARRAVDRLPAADLYPFDRETVLRGSAVEECRAWPPVEPSRVVLSGGRADLADIPVLRLVGDRDLATPLESAVTSTAADLPRSRVEVVRGAGHIVTARPGRGRAVVRDFLLR